MSGRPGHIEYRLAVPSGSWRLEASLRVRGEIDGIRVGDVVHDGSESLSANVEGGELVFAVETDADQGFAVVDGLTLSRRL